jgi:hypothetical protein
MALIYKAIDERLVKIFRQHAPQSYNASAKNATFATH